MGIQVQSQDRHKFDKVARWLERVLHPAFISVLTVLLVMYLSGVSLLSAIGWVVLMVIFLVGPLLVFNLYNTRREPDSHLVARDKHTEYVLAGIGLVLLFVVLYLVQAPRVFIMTLYAVAAATVVSSIINQFVTKISRHAIVVAGSTALMATVSWPLAGIMGVVALVVIWSRVRLQRHTASQVWLGAIVAVVAVWLVFSL